MIETGSSDAHSLRVPTGRYVTFAAIAGLGCVVDLATKSWIFNRLDFRPGFAAEPEWIVQDIFGLQTSLNFGALFGMGQGQVWFFATLSIVAALAIVYWLFVARAAHDRLLTIALASVMGGILGNLYDRLGLWTLPGSDERICAVRDWILFEYHGWTWPNFNIADSLLVCGAAALVWHALRCPASSEATAAKSHS
jgi:signal peptidase II